MYSQHMALDVDHRVMTPSPFGARCPESGVYASILSGWRVVTESGEDVTPRWRAFLASDPHANPSGL